tara:strand:+ start:39 stop:1832 length:1794 start_codon:yes stop_codon:yes gene_type:complete
LRFSVGKKIGGGFGIVVLLLLVVFVFTFSVVNDAIKSNDKFLNVDQPSLFAINKLKDNLSNTHSLMQKWVNDQSAARSDEPFKLEVALSLDSTLLNDVETLVELSTNWSTENSGKTELNNIKEDLNVLIISYNDNVRNTLNSIDSYQDGEILFTATVLFEEIQFNYEMLFVKLNDLGQLRSKIAEQQQLETNKQFSQLINGIIFIGIILVIGTIFIAFLTTLSITKPVQRLKAILLALGKGVFPNYRNVKVGNDEIGEMSEAMITLVDGLKKTAEFAHEVGQSNFSYSYEPMSDEDVLGHALLKMKDELAETERILEQKVKERTEEVVKQKDEIDSQRAKLEELYNDVTDSIRYAKRLQNSILPPEVVIKKYFPSSFVLFKPKDIVSGDFYWVNKSKNECMFAAVDCTGHGVPGAFMSLVGANGLNGAVNEHKLTDPGLILDDLNNYANLALNKHTDENAVRDGMDITLCSLNKKTMKLKFAGAYNPVYLIRNNELEIIKTDKFAIGSFTAGEKHYNTFELDIQKGDKIYIFSDGYADQFGGLKGKKFMYRQFKETLLSTVNESMEDQKQLLDQKIEAWKGSYSQVDDIVIFGVEVD